MKRDILIKKKEPNKLLVNKLFINIDNLECLIELEDGSEKILKAADSKKHTFLIFENGEVHFNRSVRLLDLDNK